MQETSIMKVRRGRPFTEGTPTRAVKNALHPLLMSVAKSAVTFRIVKDNDYSPLPKRPIIFVANHYCGQDVVIAVNALHGRVTVVAGKQSLTPVDEFFFNTNGTIFVDRKDKADCTACKRAMAAQLKRGQNVLIFPEGTSNVSDELLMYPMKWGTVEVARQVGAQVIPMVLDYDKDIKECHIRFCKPMVFDDVDNLTGINRIRDTMATVRWEFWERKPRLSRAEMDIENLRRDNMSLLLSYKLLDYEYERSVVFRPYPDWDTVMEPVYRILR